MSNYLQPHRLYSPWNSPGQNARVGSLSLLQGLFPTQGSNPGLPQCRRILSWLSHKGSPNPIATIQRTELKVAFQSFAVGVHWHISVLGMDYKCRTKYLSLQVASGCEHPGGVVGGAVCRVSSASMPCGLLGRKPEESYQNLMFHPRTEPRRNPTTWKPTEQSLESLNIHLDSQLQNMLLSQPQAWHVRGDERMESSRSVLMGMTDIPLRSVKSVHVFLWGVQLTM